MVAPDATLTTDPSAPTPLDGTPPTPPTSSPSPPAPVGDTSGYQRTPDLDALAQGLESASTSVEINAQAASILLHIAEHVDRLGHELKSVAHEAAAAAKSVKTIATQSIGSACQLKEVAAKACEAVGVQTKIENHNSWAAWHLGRIAFHSEWLKDLEPIAKRGNRDCPVHIHIGNEEPIRLIVDLQQTAYETIQKLLTGALKVSCDWMVKFGEYETRHHALKTRLDKLEEHLGRLERDLGEAEPGGDKVS